MAYPRFQRARAFKFSRRTAGDVTVSSTALAAVDTGLDLTLDAQVGDTIEYGVAGLWGAEAFSGVLDVATMVSSAPVNYFSNGTGTSPTNGAVCWFGPPSVFAAISGSLMYTLQAGDISSGVVSLRIFSKITSAGSKLLYASTNGLQVWAKNIGPVDPN